MIKLRKTLITLLAIASLGCAERVTESYSSPNNDYRKEIIARAISEAILKPHSTNIVEVVSKAMSRAITHPEEYGANDSKVRKTIYVRRDGESSVDEYALRHEIWHEIKGDDALVQEDLEK